MNEKPHFILTLSMLKQKDRTKYSIENWLKKRLSSNFICPRQIRHGKPLFVRDRPLDKEEINNNLVTAVNSSFIDLKEF